MTTDPFTYVETSFDRFLDELFEYLRIPSISTLPERAPDMRRAAAWTAADLRRSGMAEAKVLQTVGHPVVYAEWPGAPGAPTVLVYGHYDVQPVDPLDEWDSDPFEPDIRDDHIVARGSADDKGQVFIHLKAVEALMQASGGRLPINLKVLIEGEEEIGSRNLDAFIEANRDLLACDVVVISDSTMLSLNQPAISTAFRGMVYMELEVRGPTFDLHSGQHGGVVHNPVQALCEIVAGLHNADGSVNVPGFYDRVRPIDPAESAALAQLYNEDEFRAETGAPQPWGEPAFNLRERIVARPTLELNGIVGGFTGAGQKTVLPAKALAKISCRLVADQDPYEIERLVRARVEALTPPTVRAELRALSHTFPVSVSTASPAMAAAVRAYERGFGVAPIFMRKGGSLPVIATFTNVFQVPVIAAGFGLPSDRVHGPNERFGLECLRRGLTTIIALYTELGGLRPAEIGRA